MSNAKICLIGILLGHWSITQSAEIEQWVVNANPSVNTALQVEAKQADLAKLLDEIALKTGIKLHYSVLPKVPVTATCVGATAKQVLECLLGENVDMAFRYPENKAVASGQPVNPEEVWILGSSLHAQDNAGGCSSGRAAANSKLAGENGIADNVSPTQLLLRQANAKSVNERADAIANLAVDEGSGNDASVRTALEKALSDKSAQVRAQAINALAFREGEAAVSGQLQQALQDSDAGVRMMAVDNIESDTALLQQALQDKDVGVRDLAQLKLDVLSKQ
ncbi:MAG: HEAT repeat domain-containing protein [Methylococcaceae bacterium]|nr:HEAT repeat domain-containing protein [Methylococcaceae bacterium]MDP3904286.1 HEAT repeat domain-containing protein [Methylococcaceae bacterium]